MTRTATPTQWARVTTRHPCPICNRPDWCAISADGATAYCMRVPSDHAHHARDGSVGYLHTLDGQEANTPPPPPAAQPERLKPADCMRIMERYRHQTQPADLDRLGTALGVTAASLLRLCAANAARAFAFPMFDERRRMIGIRYRAANGRKWAEPGSRNGLFIPIGLTGRGPLIVPEGPTDTAALLDLGADAIGRPSCSAGDLLVAAYAYHRDLVIMADRDPDKLRPDGSTYNPGADGAAKLARICYRKARSVKIIKPHDATDAREWLRQGATPVLLAFAISLAPFYRPPE